MKHAFWGYMIIGLGLVIIAILMLVNNLTTADEEDFYVAREVMQSAMTEATDYGSYLTSGEVVMSREKFVEIFLRRFAESVTPNKNYQVDFYQIYEYPPAATVRIRTTTGATSVKNNAINVDVDTVLSAILVVGKDQTYINVIDAKDIMKMFNVEMQYGNTYRVSKVNCKTNCTSSTNTEAKKFDGGSGNSYLKISEKSAGEIKIKNIDIKYKDSNYESSGYRSATYTKINNNNIKENQSYVTKLLEPKKDLESVRIKFTRISKNEELQGDYMVEFKYDKTENVKFACTGGYKTE